VTGCVTTDLQLSVPAADVCAANVRASLERPACWDVQGRSPMSPVDSGATSPGGVEGLTALLQLRAHPPPEGPTRPSNLELLGAEVLCSYVRLSSATVVPCTAVYHDAGG
jgi:hypothetical protein